MPTQPSSVISDRSPPFGLQLASVLCWIYGVVTAVDALLLLTVTVGVNPSLYFLLLAVVRACLAGVYFYAGVGLWRGKPRARWYAVLPSLLSTVSLALFGRTPLLLAALALNVLIIVLVLAYWSRMAGSFDQVGA